LESSIFRHSGEGRNPVVSTGSYSWKPVSIGVTTFHRIIIIKEKII
jgi:hypothetical protein